MPINQETLEAALPTLTNKLAALTGKLTEEERAVFSSIVNSAALHLKSMDAISSTAAVEYAKPISAAATVVVRNGLVDLPGALGLND